VEVVEDERGQRAAARDADDLVAGVADRVDRATDGLDLDLLDRTVRGGVGPLDQLARQLGERTGAVGFDPAGLDEAARGVEDHGRENVRRAVGQSLRDHRGHNSRVPLPRISWIVTVGICLVAAVLLLISGYSGYAAVLVAIGAAAAVNLF